MAETSSTGSQPIDPIEFLKAFVPEGAVAGISEALSKAFSAGADQEDGPKGSPTVMMGAFDVVDGKVVFEDGDDVPEGVKAFIQGLYDQEASTEEGEPAGAGDEGPEPAGPHGEGCPCAEGDPRARIAQEVGAVCDHFFAEDARLWNALQAMLMFDASEALGMPRPIARAALVSAVDSLKARIAILDEGA